MINGLKRNKQSSEGGKKTRKTSHERNLKQTHKGS